MLSAQEFRFAKNIMRRQMKANSMDAAAKSQMATSNPAMPKTKPTIAFESADDSMSVHSHEDSSIYGLCGYFYRFSEKSTPFDGGLDESMLEEDVLAFVGDESSCYFSEESEEDGFSAVDSAPIDSAQSPLPPSPSQYIVSNSTLNVLRYIGRYLQMCRLLHSITPHIVRCMIELIDFYIFAVHEMFANDLPVPRDNLYTNDLKVNHARILQEIIPKVKNWTTTSFSMVSKARANHRISMMIEFFVVVDSN